MTPAGLSTGALVSSLLLSAVAALAGLFARSRQGRALHHAAMIASGAIGLAGAAAFLAWQVPRVSFGASPLLFHAPLVVDRLAAFFLLLVHGVALMASWFAVTYTEPADHEARAAAPVRLVLPLTAVFVLSMQAVVLSSGLASFMLFWEAMSLSAFVLVMADREGESQRAALLYLAIAQFGAGALIVGCGIAGEGSIFATFDTLAATVGLLSPAASATAAALVIFAFASKAGLAPFHAWLPEAHPRAPSHVSALMSGAMLKVALYGLIRFTAVGWPSLPPAWGIGLLALGLAGATVAAIYANIAREIKRILAWSSVENIGLAFVMFGFRLVLVAEGWPTLADAVMAALFLHLLAHALFKAGLFFTAGAVMHGTRTGKIEALGGLANRMPKLSAAALLLILAAAALPPFGSFAAEWMLVQAVLASLATRRADVVVTGVAVLTGLAFVAGLAVFAMVRLFSFVFLAEPRSVDARAAVEPAPGLWRPVAALALGVLCLGLLVPWLAPLFPGPFDIVARDDAGRWAPAGTQALQTMAGLGLAIAAALAGAWAVRRTLARHESVRRYHTWDCGQPIDESMEYSATGFSAPVRFFLRDIVRAEKHLVFRPVTATNPWIRHGRMEFRKAGGILARLYFPVAKSIEAVGDRLRHLQNGVIQFYIALILATLLVTLWVAL
jgi:hydrogenase-4 component B